MLVHPVSLQATAAALRSDQLSLAEYIEATCARIEAAEPLLQALLPEEDRRARLLREAQALLQRYPDPEQRPALYGVLVGVKDLLRVTGFPTRAGSTLPAELFAGPEASCVARLRQAGALIVGKTASTEFAFFEPGPTRNPHNPAHTPGGSSSGSAAAIAAGYCSLALGTQTIGSIVRPAAFCGVVGYKPTYGRIPTDGLVPCAPSLDHLGLLTADLSDLSLVASLLCTSWRSDLPEETLPVLGVPDGPYLDQAEPEARAAFEQQVTLLETAGYRVRRVPALGEIKAIAERNQQLVFAEMARAHAAWYATYAKLYRPRTAAALLEGQKISETQLEAARAGRQELRIELETSMQHEGLDLWICPAAPGPAPLGLESTGSPALNLPWTHAGLPALTLPAGRAANGLPLGLQCVAASMCDEQLLHWVAPLSSLLSL